MMNFGHTIIAILALALGACGDLTGKGSKAEPDAPCSCESCECYEDGSCTCEACECETCADDDAAGGKDGGASDGDTGGGDCTGGGCSHDFRECK